MVIRAIPDDGTFWQRLVEMHPTATACVELDGTIRFANDAAISLLDLDEDAAGERLPDALAVGLDTLAEVAGSSQWQPFTAEIARGRHKGIRVALMGRGIRSHGSRPACLIVQDEAQQKQFREHTRLVSRLNSELKRQHAMKVALDRALDNEKHLHTELIHRVKNNLAILSALMNSKASASDDPAVVEALRELQLRTRAVALAHDLLDRRREIDIIDAEELLDELCNLMEEALCPPDVRIERELIPFRLHISDATPLCLVVNELVTNSLKHAFVGRSGGTVKVALKRNGVDKLEVGIADDGPGIRTLPEGRAATQGTGIVDALAQQLGGELQRHEGGGERRWTLIFPPRDLRTLAA